MGNFEKFAEWLFKLDQSKEGNGFFEYFLHGIYDLRCEDFRWYYFMAMNHNNKDENALAFSYIEKSIALLNQSQIKCRVKENANIIIYQNKALKRFRKQKLEGEIYYLAGEIAAKNNNNEKSLLYYQKAHYYKVLWFNDFPNENYVLRYSYRPITIYSLADIINNELTVVSPLRMNDPFDSLFKFWATEDNLNKTCTEKKHISTLVKSFNSFRIRSFTTKYNDVLMWSHYADEHKGICIKYRLSSHFIQQDRTENNVHMFLKTVSYQDTRIRLDTDEIKTDLAFATKKKDWDYEDEVRLISYNPNVKEDFYSIKLDQDSYIEEIYFGYRCEERMITMIKNLFHDKQHQPKFFKMELDPSDVYNLKAISI